MDNPRAWMSPDPRREVARAEPQEAAGSVGAPETGSASNAPESASSDPATGLVPVDSCARVDSGGEYWTRGEIIAEMGAEMSAWRSRWNEANAEKDAWKAKATELEAESVDSDWMLCDEAHSPIRYPDPDGDEGCPLCKAICDGHEEVVVLRARAELLERLRAFAEEHDVSIREALRCVDAGWLPLDGWLKTATPEEP